MDTESARFPVATPSGVHNEVENGSALYIALLTLCNFRVKYDVILKCHYSYSRKDDMFKGTPVQQEYVSTADLMLLSQACRQADPLNNLIVVQNPDGWIDDHRWFRHVCCHCCGGCPGRWRLGLSQTVGPVKTGRLQVAATT